MHLLHKLKLIYNGFLLSLISFVMFGILNSLFDNSSYNFKGEIKQNSSIADSFNEEFSFKFIKGEFIGSYSLTQLDDILMHINYTGYYLKFFSNYITFSIASRRSDKSISSRFTVKKLKIYPSDDSYLLVAEIPSLIVDNKIVRESRISYSGQQVK
ncbi:hypothetical protein PTW35_25970 (plasmid) [Photobacterium sp. DA100]|uniref:hypothetical protein n=1 Tax=Photobacterium sp. DA100 TaxID=3027472 RepID=UPI0024789AC9|nr:hypothetical protein [Photobacterium sp. DA100]WEM44704.1 hypothetical protein PTW35_25970 [Photobacterium sp. DA100]